MSIFSRSPRARRVALLTAFSVIVAGLSFGGAAGVAAADGPTTYSITGGTWQASLQLIDHDISVMSDGDVIQLNVDVPVDVESQQFITFTHSATLDLNGHALDIDQIKIGANKTLTIEDSGTIGTIYTDPDNYFASPAPGIEVDAGESLIVEGGTIDANGAAQAHNGPGIGSGSGTAGSVTVHGGSIYAYGGTDGAGIGGSAGHSGGSFTQDGGFVYARGAGNSAGIGGGSGHSGGTVNISGGTLTAIGAAGAAGIGGGSGGGSGSFTISAGTVTATGQAAGIGSGDGSSSSTTTAGAFSITGGDVTATSTGTTGAAGIGGGYYGNAGNIDIEGGTVYAYGSGNGAAIGSGLSGNAGDITIKNATVTATSEVGPAIGGGSGGGLGSVGNILIGEGADVTASASSPNQQISVVGAGYGAAFATFELAGELNVPTGNFVYIPSGQLLTIDSTGILSGDSTVAGSGTVDNGGIIKASDVWDILRATRNTLTVTGNDFLVNFEPISPNTSAPNTEISERIYAPSFADADTDLPPLDDQQGEIARGWADAPDGGDFWDPSTDFTDATTTLYGLWDAVTSISISADSPSIPAGGNTGYTVTGTGSESDTSDQTAWATVTSSDASDGVDAGAHTVTASKAGTHTIHATLVSLANNPTLTSLGFFTVTAGDAGDPPVLAFVDAPTTAYPGLYFNYSLGTTDAYGNPVTAVPTKLKSSVSSDTVKGATIKFAKLGSHTITATSGTTKQTIVTNVVLDTAAVDLTAPANQIAGKSTTVHLQLTPGLSGATPIGKVRVYYGTKYVSASVTKATAISVKLPVLKTTGGYPLHVKYYGSGTYATLTSDSQAFAVLPAAASKLVFENPSTKGYLGDFPVSLDTADKYGNVVTSDEAVGLSTPTLGLEITSGNMHISKLGKAVIHATDSSNGFSATRTFTVVKDTPPISALTPSPIDANVETTVSVQVSPVHSNAILVGAITLHLGTQTIVGNSTIHTAGSLNYYTVDFDLPATSAGTYSAHITFAGDGAYNAVTTKTVKVTVAVPPGA